MVGLTDIRREEVRVWLAATSGFSLGSGLGTHCNRKRRLNAAAKWTSREGRRAWASVRTLDRVAEDALGRDLQS